MPDEYTMRAIAHIRSDFDSKFGIPRQSGVVPELEADIVFTPEFRNPDALRGIERCSHIWLIWLISGNLREGWQPTVRPPRLGGNARWGVFSTRSPFRPNPIGLSCVRLGGLDLHGPEGPVLHVLGADLMDGTPILDIKPYAPYTDSIPDATDGIAARAGSGSCASSVRRLCSPACLSESVPPRSPCSRKTPAPPTRPTPTGSTAWPFAGFDIRFTVSDGVLTVRDIIRTASEKEAHI